MFKKIIIIQNRFSKLELVRINDKEMKGVTECQDKMAERGLRPPSAASRVVVSYNTSRKTVSVFSFPPLNKEGLRK